MNMRVCNTISHIINASVPLAVNMYTQKNKRSVQKMKLNREILTDMGYADSIVFSNPDYDDAIIGISHDDRVIL